MDDPLWFDVAALSGVILFTVLVSYGLYTLLRGFLR